MGEKRQYFLCGAGGSGMLPLALILRAAGHAVGGSDRALDQGRTAPKFDYLRAHGVQLFPQDGSGLVSRDQILVASAAVEDTVPDVQAAIGLGAPRMSRARLLADLFNAAETPIGVAGTSGKSTTVAMIAWILHAAGRDPTVMNGAVMKNFVRDGALFTSALVGQGPAFVSEIDESDGSIAMFNPKIAVLNNVSLDHKSMAELRALFGDFLSRAQTAVLNADNEEVAALGARAALTITYGLSATGDLGAEALRLARYGVSFTAVDRLSGARADVTLKVPGRHNVSNALAAIAASVAAGVRFEEAARAIAGFEGVRRRFELVGEAAGVAVIDDFGHNPDKIAATLDTLHAFPGRLLILFQPHGYGPLKVMRTALVDSLASKLRADDLLVLPDPVYQGGTVAREVTSAAIVDDLGARGAPARYIADRGDAAAALVAEARPGDRIVVMGARDDTLSLLAAEMLAALAARN